MCPECAEFNFFKRTELADLRGRVALLTGGRVKIGYQAGLKLLRAGATSDRDDSFPERFGAALCGRSGFWGVAGSARNFWAGYAAYA